MATKIGFLFTIESQSLTQLCSLSLGGSQIKASRERKKLMAKLFTIAEGLENIGALRTGGQGSVYKGRRIGEIITAVKILPTPIHAEDENDKNFKDFQNEVSKLKKVNQEPNPNVVKILSSGITESGSLPFIEMEFIEGPDLEDLLKAPNDAVFSIREVIKVANQLSNALAHCHKVSVKHGDIKSNNVKFNVHSGNYMLLDFGLAVMSDEQRRTSLRYAGAIEFMAPEQNAGEMLLETDVYSFGIVLFELLAGVVPFPLRDNRETSRNAVMICHMEEPAPSVLEIRKNNLPADWTETKKEMEMLVPEWLLSIIAKCLEKLPENRFHDGVELHEAVMANISSFTESHGLISNKVSLLQLENERLKDALVHYQQASVNNHVAGFIANNNVNVLEKHPKNTADNSTRSFARLLNSSSFGRQKPLVKGLIIILISLTVFAGYSMVTSSSTKQLQESITNLERLNAKRVQDSIGNAQIYAATKDSLLKAQERLRAQEESNQASQNENEKGKKKKKFRLRFW
ncbi:MAG: serine/threonine protein kinase [Sphingobacteriales bacterium]|nr:serine/threonine protein kinase [Sphingobacteriales bacterium]